MSNRLDSDLEKLVEDHIERVLQENKSSKSKQSTKKSLKRKYVASPPSSATSSSISSNTTTTTIDPSLHQMKFLIEDFTDRKSQLSINSYDIIDQHIRVVDEEIKLLETAIRLSGADVPPVPTMSEMEEMFVTRNHKKKKKKEDKDATASSEPLYCLCQRANYGDMIRCDNDGCSIEWFHYPCVGLTKEPIKRWLCPECINHK